MTEIETENKNFLLKGIEHVFLKFKGVKSSSKEDLMITNAKISVQQERQSAITSQTKIEQDNAHQYQLLQQQLKQEKADAIAKQKLENQEKEQKIEKQAQLFLDANLYDLYLTMLDNGYTPNKKQRTFFVEHVNDLIFQLKTNVDLSLIENYLEKGYHLSTSNSFFLLSQPNFQNKFFNKQLFDLSDNTTTSQYPKVFEQLKKNLNSQYFQEHLAIKFLSAFESKAQHNQHKIHSYTFDNNKQYTLNFQPVINIPVFLEYMPDIILPKISLEQFVAFMSQWKGISLNLKATLSNTEVFAKHSIRINNNMRLPSNTTFYDTIDFALKSTVQEYYSKDIQQLMNSTKAASSENYVEEKMIKNTQILSTNYKVNNLPENTKEIFHDLQNLYNKLEKYRNDLTQEQVFLIDNLFEKRIPEALQKYLSIDIDYRQTMKNRDGKNAQDLMDESLLNFKNKLVQTLEDINQLKLSNLNVTKRYSKNI